MEDSISYDITIRIVTVHILDTKSFLYILLLFPPSRYLSTIAFLRAATACLPGIAHQMFPWSEYTEIASFIGETWDHSAISIPFHIDDEGNAIHEGQGIFLTAIVRPIRKIYEQVDQTIHSLQNASSPLHCDHDFGIFNLCETGFVSMTDDLIRFHEQRLQHASNSHSHHRSYQVDGPAFGEKY